MAYLGNNLQVAYQTYKNIDDISASFNGVTKTFALLVNGVAPVPAPLNSNQCLISVAGVVQQPDDTGTKGFKLSGSNIVFSSAPAGGASFFGIILAGSDYINVGANFPSGTAAVPSITFDGDPDTGLFNSASNELGFTTGGSNRLTIDSAGLIKTKALGSVSAPVWTFIDDSDTGIYSPGSNQLSIGTNGVQRIAVDGSGRVGINVTPATNTRLDLSGTYAQNIVAVAALDIDCSAGNYFTKTINGNSTFTFSNVPASRAFSFTLELTHTSGTVTWPTTVKWPEDTAPTLTTGKTHLFIFVTDDGGTRWRGAALVDYVN